MGFGGFRDRDGLRAFGTGFQVLRTRGLLSFFSARPCRVSPRSLGFKVEFKAGLCRQVAYAWTVWGKKPCQVPSAHHLPDSRGVKLSIREHLELGRPRHGRLERVIFSEFFPRTQKRTDSF